MKQLIFLFLLIFFSNCNQNSGVIERSKFVKILSEIYLAEALAIHQDTGLGIRKDHFKSYEQEILTKHHIDTMIFNKTYEFYNKDLNEMQKIYDEVINNISAIQATGIQ